MSDIIYNYPKSSCFIKKNCGGIFKNTTENNIKNGFTYLNPEAYQEKVAKNFENECKKRGEETFTSSDPRLIDVPRAFRMELDRIPMDSSIELKNLYSDNKLSGYGKNYKSYKDINAGQILYYTDSNFSNPFYGPNFGTNYRIIGDVYRDPMDGLEIQYKRIPCVKPSQMKGLSELNDTSFNRDDLMSGYSSQINKYSYTPRYN